MKKILGLALLLTFLLPITVVDAGTPIESAAPEVVFEGHLTADQSVTAATWTVVNITADIDTGSYFNGSTHRFTPLIAGTYFATGSVDFKGTDAAVSLEQMQISKNGLNATAVCTADLLAPVVTASSTGTSSCPGAVSMNGSTDTLELDGINNLTSANAFTGGAGRITKLTIWRVGP